MSQVWCVSAVDVGQQIRTLLEQNQFQLALKLTVKLWIKKWKIFLYFLKLFFSLQYILFLHDPYVVTKFKKKILTEVSTL